MRLPDPEPAIVPTARAADIPGGAELIDAMASGVVLVDRDGVITRANRVAHAILGWEEGSLVGAEFHATAHFQRPDGSAYPTESCPVVRAIRDQAPASVMGETLWKKDGTAVPVDITVGPLPPLAGADGGAIITFGDASERVAFERAKDEFISMVSHELRTPLASLSGALRLLAHAGLGSDESQPLLDLAVRNADRLHRLIDDILDLERAAAGQLVLRRAALRSAALVDAAIASVAGMALEAEVSLVAQGPDVDLWGDRHLLTQVLTNLLGNAVKHSSRGAAVTVTTVATRAEVRFAVADTGPGLSREEAAHVFDRFWQADSSDRRSRGGSGLGLAIASAIMAAHGGRLSVDSEPGHGATFMAHVPHRSRATHVPVDRREMTE